MLCLCFNRCFLLRLFRQRSMDQFGKSICRGSWRSCVWNCDLLRSDSWVRKMQIICCPGNILVCHCIASTGGAFVMWMPQDLPSREPCPRETENWNVRWWIFDFVDSCLGCIPVSWKQMMEPRKKWCSAKKPTKGRKVPKNWLNFLETSWTLTLSGATIHHRYVYILLVAISGTCGVPMSLLSWRFLASDILTTCHFI